MTIALHDQRASHLWLSLHATCFSTHLSMGSNPINPLSPNIHVQILQTDLYTLP